MTRCIIMGSLVSPVSILGPLPLISEHTPIKTLALVTIFVVKLMCWWRFQIKSIKICLDLKDLSRCHQLCLFSRSPLQGLCKQGSDWNNFHEKPPQFQASYLTNCGCIKSRSKTASGLLWDWAEHDCRVRFGSFHLINLRYLTLSSFHDFHLRFIYKYLVQFQQSASF